MSFHISDPSEVWKHKLPIWGSSFLVLELPLGHEIVHFDVQGEDFCIWEVHKIRERERKMEYTFWLGGTGSEIPGWLLILNHVGTLKTKRGLVLHLFHVSDQRGNMEPKE